MYKKYNVLFFILLFTVFFLLSSIGFVNQPLVGDLTRIGGFRENEFGWNKPQNEFENVLFDQAETIADYDHSYDVVVLADSFVFLDQERSWLNFFVARTGLKVLAFHQNYYTIKDIVESDQFRKTPPRVFIYEAIERGLIGNIYFQDTDINAEVFSKRLQKKSPPIRLAALPEKKVEVRRDIQRLDFNTMLSEASSYVVRLLKRKLFDYSRTAVLALESDTPLFSNTKSQFLLVSKKDFDKNLINDSSIKNASDKIVQLQKKIENNGKTEFLLIVMPDKTTVYQAMLKEKINYSSVIERLAKQYPLLRIDSYLQQKIDEGVVDVYLPNDTHTGSYSNEYVAEIAAQEIQNSKNDWLSSVFKKIQ